MSDFDAVVAALGAAEDDDALCTAFGTGRDAVIPHYPPINPR